MIPNWLDMSVSLLVIAGAFRGYRRGLVREAMALAGLIGGMAAAARWQGGVSHLLAPFVGRGAVADAMAYAGVLLGVLGCATVVTLVIRKLLVLFFVEWVDAAGGALFGAAQGALLAGLVLFLLVEFQLFGVESALRDSEMAMVALGILPGAVGLLPSEFGSLTHFFDTRK